MRRIALYLLVIGVALVAPVWLQLTLSSGGAESEAAVPAQTVIAEPPARPQATHERTRPRTPTRRAVRHVPRPRKHASPQRTASASSAPATHIEPAVLIAAPRPAWARAAPAAPPPAPARPDKPSGDGDNAAEPTPPPAAPEKPKQGDVGAAPAPADESKPEQAPAAPPTSTPAADDDDDIAGAASSEPDLASMSDAELSKWVDDLIESSLGEYSELDDD